MKRFLAWLICGLLVLSLAGCGGKTPNSSEPVSNPGSTASDVLPDSSSEPSLPDASSSTPDANPANPGEATTTTKAPTTKVPDKSNTPTTKTPQVTTPVKVTQSLANTHYKLTVEKKLTVGYIGGSVTVGVGASNQEKTSWRARTTQWLKTTYPSATIQEGNAAIGATGSFLGVCRIQEELLQPYNPDLVFIEFAINDYYHACLYDESVRNMESMVRMILSANPNADIVLVYTANSTTAGQDFDAIMAFEEVAKHYGLYSVNLGKTLVAREGSDALKSKGKYLTDTVHPNDAGYEKYASYVIELLSSNLKGNGKLTKHAVPSPIRNDLYTKSTIMDAAAISAANPGVGTLSSNRNLYLKSGNQVTVKFKGATVALWWKMDTGGDISLQLDGKRSALPAGNPDGAHKVLFQGLSNTAHTLKISNRGTVTCSLRGLYVLE